MTPIKKKLSDEEIKKPSNPEVEKSKTHIIVEIIEYMANAVVIKTIIKKSTGKVSVMSFDSGERLTEKTSPFDSFAQIIEGKAEIVIDNVAHNMRTWLNEFYTKPVTGFTHYIFLYHGSTIISRL